MPCIPEWLIGLISGIFATIIGFGLTMIWDIKKIHREDKQRNVAVLSAGKEECIANINILKGNRNLLEQELTILNDKKFIVMPLLLLQTGFWDLLKTNIPDILVNEPELLSKIRAITQATDGINELIRSREIYRLHNHAYSNYFDRTELYDNLVIQAGDKLLESLEYIMTSLYP